MAAIFRTLWTYSIQIYDYFEYLKEMKGEYVLNPVRVTRDNFKELYQLWNDMAGELDRCNKYPSTASKPMLGSKSNSARPKSATGKGKSMILRAKKSLTGLFRKRRGPSEERS
jgi:hypothetical protein